MNLHRLATVAIPLCGAWSCSPTAATFDPGPLPVFGGTLVALDGDTVVAADPEGDRLLFVDVQSTLSVQREVPLARPVRLAVDDLGQVWVVSRAGFVARVDPRSGRADTWQPCPAPRGVAAGAVVDVACADGALVELDLDGVERGRASLPADLRDVVRVGSTRFVSRLRTAELLVVDPAGDVTRVERPPTVGPPEATRSPSVAWRLIPFADGVVMAHQRATDGVVRLTDAAFGAPAYGGPGCDAVVQSAVTMFFADGRPPTTLPPLDKTVLPVDLVDRGDGSLMLISAGATGLSDVAAASIAPTLFGAPATCTMLPGLSWSGITRDPEGGRVVAGAMTTHGLVLQTQSPLTLVLAPGGGATDTLALEPAGDRGVALFHAATTGSVACASCHPEGGEDGRVWRFQAGDRQLLRRTQSLAGGVATATAPLHWDGDLANLDALLDDTLVRRMGGARLPKDTVAIERWLARVPATPVAPTGSDALVDAGEALARARGCLDCHRGPWLTDGLNHDVGSVDPTGPVALQTPSLVGVAGRGPWMHDGCATTLEERFSPACGGDRHGDVRPEEIPALVAWLSSLDAPR